MSVTVVVSVPTKTGVSYPADTNLGGYRASLQIADQSAPAIDLNASDLQQPFRFPATAAGDYSFSVTRVDAVGAAIGDPVSVKITVPDSVPAPTPTPVPVIGDGPGDQLNITFE